jgi:hypothetical protein
LICTRTSALSAAGFAFGGGASGSGDFFFGGVDDFFLAEFEFDMRCSVFLGWTDYT